MTPRSSAIVDSLGFPELQCPGGTHETNQVHRGWSDIALYNGSRPESSRASRVEDPRTVLGHLDLRREDKTPGTGGRVSCTSTRRWISGGYFVESHRKCKTPHGDVDQVEVFGYDFQNRVYSYWGFNGSVVSTYTSPSMEGGRVIWTGTGVSAGNRCTEIFESPTASMDSCESSRDGGASWIPRSGGKLTKAQN